MKNLFLITLFFLFSYNFENNENIVSGKDIILNDFPIEKTDILFFETDKKRPVLKIKMLGVDNFKNNFRNASFQIDKDQYEVDFLMENKDEIVIDFNIIEIDLYLGETLCQLILVDENSNYLIFDLLSINRIVGNENKDPEPIFLFPQKETVDVNLTHIFWNMFEEILYEHPEIGNEPPFDCFVNDFICFY